MPEGKTSKIATKVVRKTFHRDGYFRDTTPAKKGRSPYDNPATGKGILQRPGVENPVK